MDMRESATLIRTATLYRKIKQYGAGDGNNPPP
jgi:hypothetical protein